MALALGHKTMELTSRDKIIRNVTAKWSYKERHWREVEYVPSF